MDTSNQGQDASQSGQQGQVPPQAQQVAHGSIEQPQDTAMGQGGQGAQASGQAGQMSGAAAGTVPAQRGAQSSVGVLRPPVDVIEDATGITLVADMPGVSKDNLNLRLEAQSLTIEGAMTLDVPPEMEPRHAEVRHQHYERTFALSRELSGEQATAELSNGVLRIRIPKSQDAVPRKIPVNAG